MPPLMVRWRNTCIAAQSVMDDLIAPALAFSGLLIATGLYFLRTRRRGHDRGRRRADQWSRQNEPGHARSNASSR